MQDAGAEGSEQGGEHGSEQMAGPAARHQHPMSLVRDQAHGAFEVRRAQLSQSVGHRLRQCCGGELQRRVIGGGDVAAVDVDRGQDARGQVLEQRLLERRVVVETQAGHEAAHRGPAHACAGGELTHGLQAGRGRS